MSRAFAWTSILAFFVSLALLPAAATAKAPPPADAVFRLGVERGRDGGLTCA